MNPDIFREYDIRGVVPAELNEESVRLLGKAFSRYFAQNNATKIAIGYDARSSSTLFERIIVEVLGNHGCKVFRLGMIPTPVLSYALFNNNFHGGIMVTGSHNPPDHNGFKVSLGSHTLFGDEVQQIRLLAEANNFVQSKAIQAVCFDQTPAYISDVVKQIRPLKKGLRLVLDAGNGSGGQVAVKTLRLLGAEVIELFCTPDSTFPNHSPDPADPKNLVDLIKTVKNENVDFGIALDGDADRITAIDNTGRIIWGDLLTAIFAREVLNEYPGATVIGEVKCSNLLFDEVEALGGNAIMCKAGHSVIKAELQKTDAVLAGEMSGHIFFADRYFGFDDAIYTATRLMELVANSDSRLSEIVDSFPKTFTTDEIRIQCPESLKIPVTQAIINIYKNQCEIKTIDGARLEFEFGWALVRPSNTQALIILRFEADSKSKLDSLRTQIESQVRAAINQFSHSE
ncbi:MAG: phosphomannomutase/phosphoglucomutase [Pyrinomonadaceae bacterium]